MLTLFGEFCRFGVAELASGEEGDNLILLAIGGVPEALKSNGLATCRSFAEELGLLKELGTGGDREESCCNACKFVKAGKGLKFPKFDRFGT